jgi:hypothetical protein
MLEARREVRLLDLPTTELRGSAEHSYYLERLVAAAIADGATHLVTLHVDSFPIRDGWVEELVAHLSGCAFVSIGGINTACLFCPSEFVVEHRPSFLPSSADLESARFQAYLAAVEPPRHSGMGYGFAAWQNGLDWHLLPETTSTSAPAGATVHGDLVFHLEGAVRLVSPGATGVPGRAGISDILGYRRFERLFAMARALLPTALRRALHTRFSGPFDTLIDGPRARLDAARMRSARELFLADPDAYIERMRGGPRK